MYNMLVTYHDLHRKLHERPFKPFRIRMVNSTVYNIQDPWMVMVGKTSAIVATQIERHERGVEVALDWKTVSIDHMMEFSDLGAKSNGSKRKK